MIKQVNLLVKEYFQPTQSRISEKLVDVVGVDLGVKTLATLSTSEVFEGTKSKRKLEYKLSRLQYFNRHKVRFSRQLDKNST
ncbi:hypothetical protein ACP6PL_08045 [Dapis sp. BLCC M126]|uniref:hypothetical protein n=1 Tax=Dapis sp. BLCC M126 TaxID=3400189 RepID=UPI003CFB64D9